MNSLLLVALVLGALAIFLLSVRSLLLLARDRRRGSLVAVDLDRSAPPLVAAALGLAGRPDLIRRLPDGRSVPLEVKSRPSPARGPLPSHVRQVEAYCLLLEETIGRSPPFGVLRYADGVEWEVPWDRAARRRVLATLQAVRQPYRGEATPTPGKCRACVWRPVCDARASG